MGVTSTAVPVKKASSAESRSWRLNVFTFVE
jgi:hypothetical protein